MSQTNESCTRFAKLLGIEVPFLNDPMEGIATPFHKDTELSNLKVEAK